MEGHGFTVLEVDGGLLYTPQTADELFLFQGRRMGVAITASTRPGDYRIRTLGWDGGVFNNYTQTDLAVFRVEGLPVDDPTPPHLPKHPRRPKPALFVPAEEVAAYRTFIMSENSPMAPAPEFYINGMLFQDRTPEWTPQASLDNAAFKCWYGAHFIVFTRHTQAVVDTTEEWLVAVSNSPTQLQDPHVWHVHTNPFAVVGQGRWDYRFGVVSYESVKANGETKEATKKHSKWRMLTARPNMSHQARKTWYTLSRAHTSCFGFTWEISSDTMSSTATSFCECTNVCLHARRLSMLFPTD